MPLFGTSSSFSPFLQEEERDETVFSQVIDARNEKGFSFSFSLSFQSSETSFFFLSAHSLSLIHVLLSLSPFFNSHSRRGKSLQRRSSSLSGLTPPFFEWRKADMAEIHQSSSSSLSLEKKYS